MKTIWVVAELKRGFNDPDRAAGVWAVDLDQDLEPEIAVGAALDLFHQKVAISELEDFEISTLDPVTRQNVFEAERYVQGSGCHGGVSFYAAALADIPTLR